jgi:hypothetical protein
MPGGLGARMVDSKPIRSVYFACSFSSCSVALDSPSAKCADPLMFVDPPADAWGLSRLASVTPFCVLVAKPFPALFAIQMR